VAGVRDDPTALKQQRFDVAQVVLLLASFHRCQFTTLAQLSQFDAGTTFMT
jgi:hypothetical protein